VICFDASLKQVQGEQNNVVQQILGDSQSWVMIMRELNFFPRGIGSNEVSSDLCPDSAGRAFALKNMS
jgi:hypothetical protein